jgi:hypothetical protein
MENAGRAQCDVSRESNHARKSRASDEHKRATRE